MPVDERVTLRPFAPQDLERAHGLSQAVKWPHRRQDWAVMAALGRGFVAEDAEGALHGVALWWPQGPDFATLGMVIVSPALQKAGIGRRLMGAIVEAAQPRRIQLNATAEGLRLYQSFGFAEIGGIHQHHGTLAETAAPAAGGGAVRPLVPADHEALRALDREATGVARDAILTELTGLSRGFALERDGRLAGFLLARDFGRGRLLGPLVAEDEAGALALLSTGAVAIGGFLRADIPEEARLLATWLAEAGLPEVGAVRTMLRGDRPAPAERPRVFGLASQALG